MDKIQLTIFISRTSVHVAEVLRSTGQVKSSASKLFEAVNETNIKQVLTEFFSTLNWEDHYEEYTLSWVSPTATLVPSRIFEASDAEAILNLIASGTISKQEVDYNRITELDIVNVYQIPLWVKSFFILKFPKIALYHDFTVNIRALFQTSTYRTSVGLHIYTDHFMLLIATKQQLVFANQFEFQSKEDVLYYLMFALQQQGLTEEKGTIHATFLTEEGSELLNELFQTMQDKKLLTKFTQASINFAFKNQLACV